MARNSRRLSRRPGTADEAETIAIVCEGEKTEDIYFNGIRREFRLATARLRVVTLGADPLRVVQEAEALRPEYDNAWAVFDVEAPGAHAIPHARLNQAVERAARVGVQCAISNPCFELWLLLHFSSQTAFVNNEAVRAKIKKCPCGYSDKGFDFAKVWPHHQQAMQNAAALHVRQQSNNRAIGDRNPWTSVHELVGKLLELSKRQG
ncbi:RloB family protein [Paractinoplanes ferrugineus]|uniref:RloB-like protein n=1 Tax=Paractinoplanes ferrugineus TaxID=113564 RepID=A0A919ITY7_9ACTN|nr:RloB family protein [Actinoplanes ferrugineus]GIE08950.1 hypothetical protein Afe05nite_07900 [Actinoplanes ferrugineus]